MEVQRDAATNGSSPWEGPFWKCINWKGVSCPLIIIFCCYCQLLSVTHCDQAGMCLSSTCNTPVNFLFFPIAPCLTNNKSLKGLNHLCTTFLKVFSLLNLLSVEPETKSY